jgi:rfaE bifunctional protein nucleotidyltransferase chain/domain
MMMSVISPPEVMTLAEALIRRQNLREKGQRLVFTNGCFDLLHAGHVTYLQQARALGDALWVGLNTDASIQGLKGPLRPIVPEKERAIVMAALGCVDGVVFFSDPTPNALIAALQPDIHTKGGDYAATALPEYSIINVYGGEVKILPFVEGMSSSNMIGTILERYGNPPK